MRARTRSLTLTSVTSVVFVAHAMWIVVGMVLSVRGSLSWSTYFGVGLGSWLVVRHLISLSERALSEFLRSAPKGRTDRAE